MLFEQMHETSSIKDEARALDGTTGKGKGTKDLFHGAMPSEPTYRFLPFLNPVRLRTPLKSQEFSPDNCYQSFTQMINSGLPML